MPKTQLVESPNTTTIIAARHRFGVEIESIKKRSTAVVPWGCVLIWFWKNGYFLTFGFRHLRNWFGCLRKEKKRYGERRKKEEESWRKKKEKKEGRIKLRKKAEELKLEFLQAT